VFDHVTNRRLALAQYRGRGFAGELAIPVDTFSSAHALFVKLERPLWFFDEAGWLEIPPASRPEEVPAPRLDFIEQPSLAVC